MSLCTSSARLRRYIAALPNATTRAMQVSSAFHQVLYISQLAPGRKYDTFTAVCRTARGRNADLGASGVLLFDGQRFCQLLQGPAQAVRTLMREIAEDPRHESLALLVDGPAASAEIDRHWSAGYCDAHELDVLDAALGVRGQAALATFRDIVSRADLSP